MFDPDRSVFVIAEAGVNHNGDSDLAMQMVDVASEAGADAIKFQTFDAKALVTSSAPKAHYQQAVTDNAESQQQMLAKLQLDRETHFRVKRRAEEHGLLFMSSAFDSQSLSFLANDLGLSLLKIPSGEITNGPFLLEHAQTNRDLVLSTGMSTLGEVKTALSVLAFGLTGGNSPSIHAFNEAFASKAGQEALRAHVTLLHCTTQYPASFDSVNLKVLVSMQAAFGLTGGKSPSIDAFNKVFVSEEGQGALRRHVTLLHCTTQYPAPYDSVNLNALVSMQAAFGLRIGYSDHTPGSVVVSAAVALGARVIEKHFTLDKNFPGPDHKASLEPSELRQMVDSIRTVEQSLGNGEKGPHDTELDNRLVARKSLVAARAITKGELFSRDSVAVKRPGTGRSPMEYWDILGRASSKSYEFDEFL